MERGPNAPASINNRSRVTNGSAVLAGVDGRSPLARRYRDLIRSLSEELGGDLSAADMLQVRNVATLQLHAEDLTARLVRGEPVNPEDITRAANGAARAVAALRRRRPAKPTKPPLSAYLASRGEAA